MEIYAICQHHPHNITADLALSLTQAGRKASFALLCFKYGRIDSIAIQGVQSRWPAQRHTSLDVLLSDEQLKPPSTLIRISIIQRL